MKEVTQCTVVFCLGTERSVHLLSANWRAEVMYIGGLFGFSFKTVDLQAVLSPHSLCTVDKSALAVFIQDGTPERLLEPCLAASCVGSRSLGAGCLHLEETISILDGLRGFAPLFGLKPRSPKTSFTVGVGTTRGLPCTPWHGARVPLHSHTHNQTRAADQNAPALSPQLHPSPVPRCAWRSGGRDRARSLG